MVNGEILWSWSLPVRRASDLINSCWRPFRQTFLSSTKNCLSLASHQSILSSSLLSPTPTVATVWKRKKKEEVVLEKVKRREDDVSRYEMTWAARVTRQQQIVRVLTSLSSQSSSRSCSSSWFCSATVSLPPSTPTTLALSSTYCWTAGKERPPNLPTSPTAFPTRYAAAVAAILPLRELG